MRVRTIIIVALLFVFAAVSIAAAADKKPKDEVRKASVQFYAALNSMINGNAGPLSDIWSHSATVTTMHPIGGREVGWEAVKASFEQVAKLASEGKAVLKDQLIRVDGNMAYEVGIESGQFKLAGHQVNIENRVTNIYKREGKAWKIVHHHVDISPAMVDILHQLQAKSGQKMAYGIVHFFAGGTKEQYEASIAAVHPAGGGLPVGQIFHAAGASAGGWTIVAIHDSKESWERFRDNILMPRMKEGIKGGFATPPQETAFEVYNLQSLAQPEKSTKMAFGIMHFFTGGTKEQYEASIAAVHPAGGGLPVGQIFHAAGASAGGWTIVAIHDSKENWEKFRDGILMPRMKEGIKGGFATPPQETAFEIYNMQSAPACCKK
jgi:ketosteroid isomerase-like protein